MPAHDPMAVAINSAGIADSLRVCQITDHDGANRLEDLTEHYQGWMGVMDVVTDAAKAMEHYRVERGEDAAWGCELPPIYDVWHSIARVLWEHMESIDVERLVSAAIALAAVED